jgi:hypothetical protein
MSKDIIYSQILTELYAGSEWSISNENYDELVWLSDSAKPTKSELDGKWQAAQQATKTKLDQAAADKAALLARLGITADEVKLLLS